MEKENNSNKSDFSENDIPDLNSLKPFNFEPKTNIRDIIGSSSDDEEKGAEYKVKRISNSGASAVQKYSLADVLQNRCQALNFIKKETLTQVFSYEIYEIFKNTFFYRTPLLSLLLLAVNSVNQ